MEDMIEQSIGIKFLATAGKSIMYFICVILLEPAMNFIIIQVDHYAMLSQYTKDLLGDFKLIIVLLTAFLVCIKVFVGLVKMIRDFNKK